MILVFLPSRSSLLTSLARCGEALSITTATLPPPQISLHLLETPDEGGRVKALVRPEKLPAVLGDGPVGHDPPVVSGVRDAYLSVSGCPVLAARYHVVHEERLILHKHGKLGPF